MIGFGRFPVVKQSHKNKIKYILGGFVSLLTATSYAGIPLNNCSDLNLINKDLKGQYTLNHDIDCRGVNFAPIGNIDNPFVGKLDGAGHKITNLVISQSAGNSATHHGLFGAMTHASIKDLTIENAQVVGDEYVGILAGEAQHGTTITNVHVSGTVTSNNNGQYIAGLIGQAFGNLTIDSDTSSATVNALGTSRFVGGLIGYAGSIIISHSEASGNVTGHRYMGGLVGYITMTSVIADSKATGTVNVSTLSGDDSNFIGGLVGSISSDKTAVVRSYATGAVNANGSSNVGGLVGGSDGKVKNSYATGAVTGGDNVGGLVGENDGLVAKCYSVGHVSAANNAGGLIGNGSGKSPRSTGKTLRSYWDVLTSNQSSSAGGKGEFTADLQQQSTFKKWDFDTIWNISEGTSYPWLR